MFPDGMKTPTGSGELNREKEREKQLEFGKETNIFHSLCPLLRESPVQDEAPPPSHRLLPGSYPAPRCLLHLPAVPVRPLPAFLRAAETKYSTGTQEGADRSQGTDETYMHSVFFSPLGWLREAMVFIINWPTFPPQYHRVHHKLPV